MVKYIPGLIAAVTAFLAVKLFNWAFWVLAINAEILIFLVIYVALTLIIDAAIKRYT